MGRASALLAPRALAFGVLAVALGLYYAFHASLPNTSTWGDVAFLSFVLIPAVLALVYLALPLRTAREVELLIVAIAFAISAVVLHEAGQNTLSDFAKLGAMAFAAFWFLNFFEALLVPDIDASLDDQPAKTRFWNAFKQLGPWWAELPPY